MNAALYIHFPFCRKKCAYCDFYSIIEDNRLIDYYVRYLQKEIEIYTCHPVIKDLIFQTIYLGGGTPSLLSPQQLEFILNSITNNFNLTKDPEITIEINPDTVNTEKLKCFHSIGINRLSIGVQSFNNVELQILGRTHSTNAAISCIRIAQKKGFNNINLDLIFAIPEQSIISWEKNLTIALEYMPQHISMYGLTIEPGTLLKQKISQGVLNRSTEMIEKEMYLKGVDILETNGFRQYEISNFALPGFSSRHNQMYWNGNSYLGLGPAAHSFWENKRQWNVADVFQYFKMLEKNILPIEGAEQLTREQKMMEFILLNLRKKTGVDLRLFKERFSIDFNDKFKDTLQEIMSIDDGKLIQLNEGNFKLTVNGFLLYNEICSYFI